MSKIFVPKNKREAKALEVATFAHAGQMRKGGKFPFIVHPIEVGVILAESGATSDAICAGLLHDVIEDVSPDIYSESDMRRDFGDHITEIVLTVSKPVTPNDWRIQNEIYLQQVLTTQYTEAIEVCAADKLSNVNATLIDYAAEGDALWAKFNAGKESQQWWYGAVLDVLTKRIPKNSIVLELTPKIQKIIEL